jgi:hypothetical protein
MIDLEDDLPPRITPYGYKSHPMYKQWLKMMDSCTDKTCAAYPNVGGKGISVMFRWFDFTKFIEDNQHLFDTEPSRPAVLRKQYIRRINLKSGFNPKNIQWVKKSESVVIQANTILVDTIHGKNMTLRELEKYLADHAGEPLPDGAEIHQHWHRCWNADGRLERVLAPLEVIQPIRLHLLRQRHAAGTDLLAPVREYGQDRLDDERETRLVDELDRNRKPIPEDAPYYVKNRGFV